jgi:hypothetical protein
MNKMHKKNIIKIIITYKNTKNICELEEEKIRQRINIYQK